MCRHVLYTYRNLDEFNRLFNEFKQEGKTIIPFDFDTTKGDLEDNDDLVVDITTLIELIHIQQQNRYFAQNSLGSLRGGHRAIIREDLGELALKYIPFTFYACEPFYDQESPEIGLQEVMNRKTLYTYQDANELTRLLVLMEAKGIPVVTLTQSKQCSELAENCSYSSAPIVDITGMIRNDNPHILFLAEERIAGLPRARFIVEQNSVQLALERFPLYFGKKENVTALEPGIITGLEDNVHENELRTVTTLSPDEVENFFAFLRNNLFGHEQFKIRFFRAMKDFIKLNRIKEKKILSIFLFGKPGLGKTEVARIINEYLNPGTPIAKINFGNYSSKDALNSLIGSPAGYVGCDAGELSMKIQKSKAGIVVCDEFEKTTLPVMNFFLELLEDGAFTDSLAREYDLNGYIIIFTSNITTTDEYRRIISPELQSRIDLVCKFEPLSKSEKDKFINYRLNKYMEKLSHEFNSRGIGKDGLQELIDFDYTRIDDLREINRTIQHKVVEFLD